MGCVLPHPRGRHEHQAPGDERGGCQDLTHPGAFDMGSSQTICDSTSGLGAVEMEYVEAWRNAFHGQGERRQLDVRWIPSPSAATCSPGTTRYSVQCRADRRAHEVSNSCSIHVKHSALGSGRSNPIHVVRQNTVQIHRVSHAHEVQRQPHRSVRQTKGGANDQGGGSQIVVAQSACTGPEARGPGPVVGVEGHTVWSPVATSPGPCTTGCADVGLTRLQE